MASAPSVKAPDSKDNTKATDETVADGQLVKSEDGTLSSAARHSADGADSPTVGNEGDDVSPAREDTPSDAPGQHNGEKLHDPGKPFTAGNPIARAVIDDVRQDMPVGDEGTNAEEAADAKKDSK